MSTVDAVTIGGTVTGLAGSGLVLQNNDKDDESIAADGEFTFETPLTPGTSYNVTVFTNPTNPTQQCFVANGSGQVPDQDVTDVAVICAAPRVVGKVAAEGETLPDSSVLQQISLDGGVAINLDGKVAFGGKGNDGIDAVFTQDGKVVAEGETLPDTSILATFRPLGEVAIGFGPSGEKVAFLGEAETGDNDTDAVFTQNGQVAQEGETLPDGSTLDQIDDQGKVAINNFDWLAFHGQIEIAGGLEKRRAVFTSDGQTTQVAVKVGDTLPDETPLDDITESGGVAINDFDEVGFHGRVVDPDAPADTLKAVFTADGLAAREGSALEDETLLDDINEDGGVAINVFGDVAFHGQTGGVKAVFTQAGLVAKVGDTLPDGTPLDEIEVNGGVAINIFGDLAFHGRTGGVKAVFTQNGLVAKVGDTLDDGTTTLTEISDKAGVAINPFGREVAFHGRTGGVKAVFVGR